MSGTLPEPGVEGRRLVVCDVALFYAERSGGIRTYLDEKARFAWATGAFEHHLVIPGKRERREAGRHEVRSLQLAASNGYRVPLDAGALKETLRGIRPDVVILHDPFWRPLSVTREAHRLGAMVVAVHHASPALNAAGIPGPNAVYLPTLRRIYHHAYEHVDAVMSTVDPRPDCGRPASIQLRFGLDPAFRPGPGVRGEHLLYVGRISLEKRICDVLTAMAAARWGRSLLIIGDGPARGTVEARARRLGIAGLVRFRSFVSDRRAVRNSVRLDGGAQLPSGVASVPVLARSCLDEHRLAARACIAASRVHAVFEGSVRNEVWAMATEAAAETRRRAQRRRPRDASPDTRPPGQ